MDWAGLGRGRGRGCAGMRRRASIGICARGVCMISGLLSVRPARSSCKWVFSKMISAFDGNFRSLSWRCRGISGKKRGTRWGFRIMLGDEVLDQEGGKGEIAFYCIVRTSSFLFEQPLCHKGAFVRYRREWSRDPKKEGDSKGQNKNGMWMISVCEEAWRRE